MSLKKNINKEKEDEPLNLSSKTERLTRRETQKKKRPLLASRSLLRIGLFQKNSQRERIILPSKDESNQEKSIIKTRKKMTKRASSLNDFFHSSSNNNSFPASSLTAAASKFIKFILMFLLMVLN